MCSYPQVRQLGKTQRRWHANRTLVDLTSRAKVLVRVMDSPRALAHELRVVSVGEQFLFFPRLLWKIQIQIGVSNYNIIIIRNGIDILTKELRTVMIQLCLPHVGVDASSIYKIEDKKLETHN